MKYEYNPEIDKDLNVSDLEFVNKDFSANLHDEKFKTKPTTFAKDAFKRFCKNKSSVVGAIIIGVLLLGSVIVPLVSPYSLSTTRPDEAKILPKLFDAGTGWWDGTKTYSNQFVDRRTDMPAGGRDSQPFKQKAILKDTRRSTVINTYSPYAYNGYLYVVSDVAYTEDNVDTAKQLWIKNYTTFTVRKDDNFTAEIKMMDEDNYIANYNDNFLAQKYYFAIQYKDSGITKYIDLSDDYIDYKETYTFNLSEAVENAGLAQVRNASLYIRALPITGTNNEKTYMMLKSVKMTSDNEDTQETLDKINFYDRTIEEVRAQYKEDPTVTLSDANALAGYGPDSQNNYPVGYWQSTGVRNSYKADAVLTNLLYDEYEHVYGERTLIVGQTSLKEYIDKGWCHFEGWHVSIEYATPKTFSLEKYPFVIDDAKHCPVISISEASYSTSTNSYQFTTQSYYYRYIGYSSMPRYIFGTDSSGFDLLTRCFSSLKTSLLVAIICTAVCLAIGLVWGAISGYFGGTVDLVMERITDILGGLPSIILMTLLMIKLGRNISTFALSIIITGWIGISSTTRTQFYRFRDREYVLASRTLGASDARLIFKHILPNGLGTIITSSVLRVPAFMMSEATLAYLGVGLQSTDSFGVILSTNQKYIDTLPMLIVIPAILISLLMISFNLFGNGLRDAVNPTLKGGE